MTEQQILVRIKEIKEKQGILETELGILSIELECLKKSDFSGFVKQL